MRRFTPSTEGIALESGLTPQELRTAAAAVLRSVHRIARLEPRGLTAAVTDAYVLFGPEACYHLGGLLEAQRRFGDPAVSWSDTLKRFAPGLVVYKSVVDRWQVAGAASAGPRRNSTRRNRDDRLDCMTDTHLLLTATRFAAEKHRAQRRKDAEASPYINHPIAVAATLGDAGVTDATILAAALLHDTIEDTKTTAAELEGFFSPCGGGLVEEVTDDKRPARRSPEGASGRARARTRPPPRALIKLADKICNVRDVAASPPPDWPRARRQSTSTGASGSWRGAGGASRSSKHCSTGNWLGRARSRGSTDQAEERVTVCADSVSAGSRERRIVRLVVSLPEARARVGGDGVKSCHSSLTRLSRKCSTGDCSRSNRTSMPT